MNDKVTWKCRSYLTEDIQSSLTSCLEQVNRDIRLHTQVASRGLCLTDTSREGERQVHDEDELATGHGEGER